MSLLDADAVATEVPILCIFQPLMLWKKRRSRAYDRRFCVPLRRDCDGWTGKTLLQSKVLAVKALA